jgi:hypothetical protein
MTEPRWTTLRHRLLRAVAAGEMELYEGLQWNLVWKASEDTPRRWLPSPQRPSALSLRAIVKSRHRNPDGYTDAVLTREGCAVLREWNAAHPEVAAVGEVAANG